MARQLLYFFVVGAALLGARAAVDAWAAPERPALEVRVPAGASEAEVARRVDEAILVEEGLRMGWVATDALIRDRLARNMRFVGGEGDPATLAARAVEMGMARTDPIVRRRLIQQAGAVLDRATEARAPSEAELEAHLAAHPERFAPPSRVAFAQVFLSRERRGAGLEADAEALGQVLEGRAPGEATRALGDPLLIARSRQLATRDELARAYSVGFAEAALAAEPGRWTGPLTSPWGLHLLWVTRVEAAEAPALEAVRARVEASLRHERRRQARREQMAQLREGYAIELVRGAP